MANNPKKYAGESTLSALVTKIKELFVSKTDFNSSLSNKADKSHTHSISDTTNLQSTLDAKVPTSRTINSKPLSTNIILSASDVGAASSTHSHDDRYYTETEIDQKLADKSDKTHNHDSSYATKTHSHDEYALDEVLNDHTTNSDIHFTSAERTKLSGIAAGAQVNTITGVKGNSETTYRTGNVNITKANVGLGNVDNTSDANKPISTAQQTAFDAVNDAIDTHTENADIHVTTGNKSNWNAAYNHSQAAHARTDATKVEDSTTNGNIKINGTETNVYSHPNSGVSAGTYKSVTVDTQGHITTGSNPTTLAGFGITDAETKSDASAKLTEAKTYADNAANTVKNDLLNNAGAAYDTLKELGDLIDDNKDAIDALETVAAGKANATHTHAISDVTNLQSTLDGKANSSHGTHVSYSTTVPVMDGTASVGTAATVARSDHKHPTDTSRASKTEFDSHTSDATKHITSTERTNWNAAKTHADSAHAPSNAQPNQNAFSNVKVDSTIIAADTATDTLELVGSNVTITPDTTNDKVTIAVADGTTSAKGVVQLTNSTSSTSTTTAATPNSVKSAYDLANTAKTRADSAYTLAESKVDSLSDLGITATATELNYVDGVTSNVQTQLDKKSTATNLVNGSASGSLRSTGASTTIGTGAFAVGSGTTASGNYSFAEGYNTTAEAKYSHAEGDSTTASGWNSHAEGERTVASLASAHAEGTETTASGGSAHSEGQNTTASGSGSHAEGFTTTASGSYSHAEGGDTLASGSGSHAEGVGTIAKGNYQHAQGKFNVEDTSNKYAHIVGKGASATARSNAHTLDWNGNAWYAGDVYVGGISQSDTNASKVITEADQKWNLIYDSGEISDIVNSISNIDVSGYTNIQVLVRIYNDGDSVGSRAGSAIFKCANGKNYQFPVWANMFSKSINTVYVMATFNLVDGWLICPCASRLIGDATTFEDTEGGTAGSLAPTGSGMMKCTSPLSTLTISSLDQNSNYYFGMGSRVMVWGWNG